MIETSRRSLITGLVAFVAAPAIVKVASLMPVNAKLQPNTLLSVDDITREAVRDFASKLWFDEEQTKLAIKAISDYEFYKGEQWSRALPLRIRLPNDFIVRDGPGLSIQEPTERYLNVDWHEEAALIPAAVGPLALAAAVVAVAPAVLEKPVTRRFWGK